MTWARVSPRRTPKPQREANQIQTTPHRVVIAVRSPPVSSCPPATTP